MQNTFVDGGGGTNAINDNGTNTIKANVPNANAYSEVFAIGATKTLTINGKEYTITNTASYVQNLVYSINGDTIEFQGTYFKITGNSEQSHNVKLLSQRMTFTGGNLKDTIIVAILPDTQQYTEAPVMIILRIMLPTCICGGRMAMIQLLIMALTVV